MTASIIVVYRIIKAIGEHIMAQQALPGRHIGVGVDKAAQLGIVIAGLKIIERGVGVVVVASIAQGVIYTKGAGKCTSGGQRLAVGAIGVADNRGTRSVYDVQYIALEIGDVVVQSTVVLDGIGRTHGIVEEVQGVTAPGFPPVT